MRINGQSSMNIAQMLLTDGSRTWVSKHSNILKKGCRDEYIQGIIQPSISYSKNSAGTRISRSVIARSEEITKIAFFITERAKDQMGDIGLSIST